MRKIVTKISQRQYTGPLSPEEFLSKHLKTCTQFGQFSGSCKFIVDGCYYADDTSDEFVSECIGDVFLTMEEAQRKIRTRNRELCDKSEGRGECSRALATCARASPRARIHVLWACAAKAVPKADVADAAAMPESTS